MRDQAVALEWVQENIHLFGGDRGQVLLRKMIVVEAEVVVVIAVVVVVVEEAEVALILLLKWKPR